MFQKLLKFHLMFIGYAITAIYVLSWTVRCFSLVPRPLLDFITQLWRKINFSLSLCDKIWEWPGNEANCA